MKVDYINYELTNDAARCTFIGYDSKGRRHPVIELDAGDLAQLIAIAKSFREKQKSIAAIHSSRAERITNEGVAP